MKRMQRMWKVGTSNKGFTLLELILVLFVLGLILGTVFPRIIGFSGGDMKQTTRHMARTVQYLMDRAANTKQFYRLHYDLQNHRYWATVRQTNGEFVPVDGSFFRLVQLKEPIRFEDVVTLQQGRVIEGQAYTQFYPSGRLERTLLHFTDGEDKKTTLIIQPLTGRIKVLDGYVEEG